MTAFHSNSVLHALLSTTSIISNPCKIVSASLQALVNIADATPINAHDDKANATVLADGILFEPYTRSFAEVLSQTSTKPDTVCQVGLVTSLICRLCREQRHRRSLVHGGVLVSLAARLADIVVYHGLATPGAQMLEQEASSTSSASRLTIRASILEAISVIVVGSKKYALQLLTSRSLETVLASTDVDLNRSTRETWASFLASDLTRRQQVLNATQYLVPQVSSSTGRRRLSVSAIGYTFDEARQQTSTSASPQHISSISIPDKVKQDVETESPLINALIWLARNCHGEERLMSIYLLSVLYRARLVARGREKLLGKVIIPILVDLIEQGNTERFTQSDVTFRTTLTARRWLFQTRAPAILAALIIDSEYLQQKAFEAGVVSKLSKMIKIAYDPVTDNGQIGSWSPDTSATSELDGSAESIPAPLLTHRITMRDSVLRAIAALSPFKDEYRKALIDQGVVPYIVESLKIYPDKPTSKLADKTDKANTNMAVTHRALGYGTNPTSVLIAACGAVRHLSRSVSILRTTLIDNGVVMPVFELLQHSDIEVQIAATAAVCNLVTDFSPMRDVSKSPRGQSAKLTTFKTIANAGVLKILCAHAHSQNVKLRLNALWALKHLVLSADNDMKKSCLEELGEGWLIRIISEDTEAANVSTLTTHGETWLTSGPHDEVMSDSDIPESWVGDEDTKMTDSIGVLGPDHSGEVIDEFIPIENDRVPELQAAHRQRRDDVEVQEQGLEFIRNLIGHERGGTSETSEMIDYLFNALGRDRIFSILADKLRPREASPSERTDSKTVILPQPEIVAAVGYILVHMAASIPRHRQSIIAQTELLKLVVQQFHHPNREVRIALCWLVINLTWQDDTPDGIACAQRAAELTKLGFLAKVEELRADADLDVRERAKTAVYQMRQHERSS